MNTCENKLIKGKNIVWLWIVSTLRWGSDASLFTVGNLQVVLPYGYLPRAITTYYISSQAYKSWFEKLEGLGGDMWLTACFLLSCKIAGLHSKSCKVHRTSQPTVNSFGLRFRNKAQGGCHLSTSPLCNSGKSVACIIWFLVLSHGCHYSGTGHFLYSHLFSSPLQIDREIPKPRGERYLVE